MGVPVYKYPLLPLFLLVVLWNLQEAVALATVYMKGLQIRLIRRRFLEDAFLRRKPQHHVPTALPAGGNCGALTCSGLENLVCRVKKVLRKSIFCPALVR